MSSTLSTHGYKKPSNGDTGVTVFPDLEFNIDRMDAHNHQGTDSVPLAPQAVAPVSQSISASNWVASGSGFKQTVSMPSGLTFDNCLKEFRIHNSGSIFHPTVVKVGASSYDIYINDSTLAVDAFYK